MRWSWLALLVTSPAFAQPVPGTGGDLIREMMVEPSTIDSVIDSVSTCDMMSRRLAPSALRMPISRVRSATATSMMFMITMAPTMSPIAGRATPAITR